MAEHIKHFRELRRWSQKELAAKIGDIGQTAVCNWEKGLNGPSPTATATPCVNKPMIR